MMNTYDSYYLQRELPLPGNVVVLPPPDCSNYLDRLGSTYISSRKADSKSKSAISTDGLHKCLYRICGISAYRTGAKSLTTVSGETPIFQVAVNLVLKRRRLLPIEIRLTHYLKLRAQAVEAKKELSTTNLVEATQPILTLFFICVMSILATGQTITIRTVRACR